MCQQTETDKWYRSKKIILIICESVSLSNRIVRDNSDLPNDSATTTAAIQISSHHKILNCNSIFVVVPIENIFRNRYLRLWNKIIHGFFFLSEWKKDYRTESNTELCNKMYCNENIYIKKCNSRICDSISWINISTQWLAH